MRGISFSSSTRFEKLALTPSSTTPTPTNNNNPLTHHHSHSHHNNSLSSNNSSTSATTTTTSASSSSTALHQHFPHPNPNHPSHSSSSATLAKHSLTAAKMMKKLSTTFRRKTALNNNNNNHYVSHPYVSHPQQQQQQQHYQIDNVNFIPPTSPTTSTTPVVAVSHSAVGNGTKNVVGGAGAGGHRRPTAARSMTFSTPGPTYDAFTAGGLGVGNMSVHNDYDLQHQHSQPIHSPPHHHHHHQYYPINNDNNTQRPHSHHADNNTSAHPSSTTQQQAEDKLDIPFFGADRDRDREHVPSNTRNRDRRPGTTAIVTATGKTPTVVMRVGTPAQLGVVPVGRSVSASCPTTTAAQFPAQYLPPPTTSAKITESGQVKKSSTGSVGSTVSVPLSGTTTSTTSGSNSSATTSPPNGSPTSSSCTAEQNKENECKHVADERTDSISGNTTTVTGTKQHSEDVAKQQQQQGPMSPTLRSTSPSETQLHQQERYKALHDGRIKMDFSSNTTSTTTTTTKTGNMTTDVVVGLVHHDDVDVISSMSDGRLSTSTTSARMSASTSPCPEHNLKKPINRAAAKSGSNDKDSDQASTQRMQGVLKDSTATTHGRMNLLNSANNINSIGSRIRQGVGRPPAMPRYRHLSFDAPSLLSRKGGNGHRLSDDEGGNDHDGEDESDDDMPKSLGSPMRLNRYSNGHQHHLITHHNNHHALRRHGNVNHHHNSRRIQQQQQQQQSSNNNNNNNNTKFAGRRWLLPLSESPERPRLFTPSDNTAVARMNARDRAEAVTLTSTCTFLEAEIDRMQAHVRNHHRRETTDGNTCGKCGTDVYLGKAVDRLKAVLRMLEDRYDSVETVYVKEQEWSNAMTKYLHTSPGQMRHMLSTLSAGTDGGGSSGDDCTSGESKDAGVVAEQQQEQVHKQKQQQKRAAAAADGTGDQGHRCSVKGATKCSNNNNMKGFNGGGAKKQGVAATTTTTGNLILQQQQLEGKKNMMKRDNAKSFR